MQGADFNLLGNSYPQDQEKYTLDKHRLAAV
jgi:hypothetical protein